MADLNKLHKEIGNCTVCSDFTKLEKSPNLKRGNISELMVIGMAPGRTEAREHNAFSGQAGNALFEWLRLAGVGSNETEIRSRAYLTSLIKCSLFDFSALRQMYRNCNHFLNTQIQLINPQIIITLGGMVFYKLFNKNYSLDQIVGRKFKYAELIEPDLFGSYSPFRSEQWIIPFPHPSGRSTWFNNENNKEKLNTAINILEEILRGKNEKK